MSNAPSPTFGKRGKEAVKQATSFQRTNWFKLEDGDSCYARLLTDYQASPGKDDPNSGVGGFLPMNQHQNIPTKPKPSDYKGDNWPTVMGACCRKDDAWQGAFPDCYICSEIVPNNTKIKKASQRYWALACLREPVFEDGRIVGFRDQTREVTTKGENDEEVKTVEKAIVIINLAWKNFFSILDGYGSNYGTVLDRDYKFTRTGDRLDTVYTIIPLDPIDTVVDGETVRFDLRNPELMAKYLPEAPEVGIGEASDARLGAVMSERASDEYFARFFDTRVSAPPSTSTAEASTAATKATETPDVPNPELASMIDRVKGYSADTPEPVGVGARNFD